MVSILGIPGSVRAGSLNVELLAAAAQRAGPEAELDVYEQQELASIPDFDPDAEPPEPVVRLRRAVDEADALLFATPEYNGSLPGGLKNAIDWIAAAGPDGPLRGKPAAVIGADRGQIGCDWAHADTRKVLEMARARVITDGLSIDGAETILAGDGSLLDDRQEAELGRVLEELVSEGRAPG